MAAESVAQSPAPVSVSPIPRADRALHAPVALRGGRAAAAGAGRTSERKLGVPGATRRCRSSQVGAPGEASASRRPRSCVAPAGPNHCEIRSAERRAATVAAAARQATGARSARRDGRTGAFFFSFAQPCQRAWARGRIKTPYACLDEAHCASRMPIMDQSDFASSSDTVARAVRDSACLRAEWHEIRRLPPPAGRATER
jgi:hypothetical protein